MNCQVTINFFSTTISYSKVLEIVYDIINKKKLTNSFLGDDDYKTKLFSNIKNMQNIDSILNNTLEDYNNNDFRDVDSNSPRFPIEIIIFFRKYLWEYILNETFDSYIYDNNLSKNIKITIPKIFYYDIYVKNYSYLLENIEPNMYFETIFSQFIKDIRTWFNFEGFTFNNIYIGRNEYNKGNIQFILNI